MNITIHDLSGESFTTDKNDLIVAVDETGQEEFKDPNFPLFGLSACMFLGKEYEDEIHNPWNNLKKIAGLKETDILHASEIDIKNNELVSGLGDFFKNGRFGRIAIGCSKKTNFLVNISPIDLCVKVLFNNLRQAFDIYRPNNILILIESSSRLNKVYEKEFISNKLFVSKEGVKTNIGTVDKSLSFSPIEVADFICQAHGNHILRELNNVKSIRKDMESVFVKTNAVYSYNKHITEVGIK